MSYLATHRRNILSSISITKKEIQPGDIVEFMYKSEKGIRPQVVLCLDGLTGKLTRDNKLNALKLENMSMAVLRRLLKDIDSPVLISEKRKGKEIIKIFIKADTETQREKFYKDTLKKKYIKHNIYRTYIEENIKGVKLIEYDWKSKQLGLKDEDLLQDTDT